MGKNNKQKHGREATMSGESAESEIWKRCGKMRCYLLHRQIRNDIGSVESNADNGKNPPRGDENSAWGKEEKDVGKGCK